MGLQWTTLKTKSCFLVYRFEFYFIQRYCKKKRLPLCILWVSFFVKAPKLLTTLWQIWDKVLEGFGNLLINFLWGARGISNALKNFLAGIVN
jgi:hypothetical protein